MGLFSFLKNKFSKKSKDETTEKYDDGFFYATLSPLGITITGMGYYLVGGNYDGYDFGTDTTKMTR